MINLTKRFTTYKIWFIWLITTLFGWSIVGYFGFENRNLLLSSWGTVLQTLLNLFLNGLIIGGSIGLLQFLLMPKNLRLSKSWVFVQSFIYALGSALGLFVVIVLARISIPNLFTQSQIIFPIPLSLIMLMSGSIIGLMQVLVLRNQFEIKLSEGILYLLLSSLAWGLSFFLSSYLIDYAYIQNIVTGTIIGLITGFGLFIVIHNKSKTNSSEMIF